MGNAIDLRLSVLVSEEENQEGHRSWTTQCLEYDICAQGKTVDEALNRFQKTVAGQIYLDLKYGRDPLLWLPRAPKQYWDMWQEDCQCPILVKIIHQLS